MSIKTDMDDKSNDIKTIVEEPKKTVGKDHVKYIVLLKLLNAILINIGRDVIGDITEFVDVDREDIIKEENKIY